MIRHKLLGFLLFSSIGLKSVSGQCTIDDTVGSRLTYTSNYDYDGTGLNAFLLLSDEYRFKCCGFIYAWEVTVRNGIPTLPTALKAQVWTNTGAGFAWNLRGENTIPIIAGGIQNTVYIPAGSRMVAKENDHIGFYEHLASVISYRLEGSGFQFVAVSVNGPITSNAWLNATSGDDRRHNIHAKIRPSAAPTIVNLDASRTIDRNTPINYRVFTLTVNDADIEDNGPSVLAVAVTATTGHASVLFHVNPNTYEVVTQSEQLIPGSVHTMTFTVTDQCGLSDTGTLTMTFTVTDQCGLSDTGTLTIIIDNKIPVIDSLAVSSSIWITEKLSTSTLLHTLMVTDTDAYTCALVTTGVPFEIKVIPSTISYGIFLKDGAAMNYDIRNVYMLSLSCSDIYNATTFGEFKVFLIRNEPPVINNLPHTTDVSEDTVIATTLYTFSVTNPTNDVEHCSIVSTVPPYMSFIFLKQNQEFNEFDIILQSNPNLDYDSQRTYKLNIDCTDGHRTNSGEFFMNVKRKQPPEATNLLNIIIIVSVAGVATTILCVAPVYCYIIKCKVRAR